jgi:hypothetical protein
MRRIDCLPAHRVALAVSMLGSPLMAQVAVPPHHPLDPLTVEEMRFRANARGDNQAFLDRYVCLSALVGIAMTALYYALYYGMGIAALLGGWIDVDARGWNREAMGLTTSVIASTIYYLWLRQLLVRAARARAA